MCYERQAVSLRDGYGADEAGTYPFFSVYASRVCVKGEELLAGKSNALFLSFRRITMSKEDGLLLIGAELHQGIVTRERLGNVQTLGPNGIVPCILGWWPKPLRLDLRSLHFLPFLS
jgi:hypothetical protein